MNSEESSAEDFEVIESSFSSQKNIFYNEFKLTDQGLAEIIASDSVNIKELAEEWVILFNNHALKALNILLNLVLQSAGDKDTDLESSGHKKNYFESDNEEPRIFILSIGYQERLSSFFKHLMTLQIIRHNSVLKRLEDVLIKLSSSNWITNRITAIVITNQLISSLLGAKKFVSSGNQSNSEIDEDYNQQNKEQDYIDSHLSTLLSTIIRYRIRDVDSEIRMIMIHALLMWIIEYPDEMAIDKYLKYIYLFLCDNNASIRLVAVKAIKYIGSKINDNRKLNSFMKECVLKLVMRINDVDSRVGAAAIKAIDFIDRCFEKIVPNELYEKIFIEIYSCEEKIRLAAGSFLVRQLEENEENYLADVIQFQFESPVQDYGEYLISSVFRKIPSLTKWDDWIRCLNKETDENKTVIICQLMLHTIKLAATGSYPPWPQMNLIFHPTEKINIDTSNDLLNASDKKVFSAHQKSITKYFRRIIINLFRKYEDKPKILKYFLAIPQYFDFELDFMMMVPIIDEIQQIALTSEDIAVLNNSLYHIAVLFNNIPKEGKEYVKGNQDILIERIVYQSFIPTLRKLITSEGTVMNNEIKNCLERTAVLAKYFNLTHTPLVEMVFEALDSSVNNLKVLEIKVFSNICFQIICWKLNGILDILEVDDYVSEEEVETLKVLNHKLFDLTIKILTLDLEERLKSMAFIISWKLLMTFSQRNLKLKRLLPAVIYPSEAKLEWLCYHLTASVPYFFNAEIIPSPEHEYLLSKYCNLLENHVIKSCNIANIVPYFQTEEYIKIVSRPLHILLRDEISMQSTVVSLVYALEVLLTKCQRNEDISEQILQNILDGICTSLHPKYKGLGKAIQEIQIVGLGCIYATQNTTFFKILEFFVPLVRKPKSIEMLKGLIFQHFPHIDRFAVMSYITSLDQIEEALTKEKHSEKVSTEITDDELPSGFSWEVISSASNTSE